MAAANSTVKYGIIGVGMMGREHLINLHHLRSEGVTVVAIADPHVPSQELALELAHSFDWQLKVFSGHQELLDSGLCDVVVVSSPNMTHYEILMDIIKHPKPHQVLVEKPLCTTVAHCKEVVNAARKRQDMLVQVGLEYRYMPPVAKLIEIVKGGTLGHVKMVAIREHRFPFLVKVNNWNRFNANTGGTLVEKCCHFFDLMRLFAGANPVRVMASGAMDVNHKDETYDGKVPDIIDNAYVIVEFDNGSRGMLDLCMFAEGSKNEQEISVVGDIGKGEAFVPESIARFGTRVAGRDGVQTLKAEDSRIKYDGLHHGSSYLEHLNFLHAIRAKGKQALSVDLQDGLISVAIGVAAQLSIEKGRFFTIEEVMDEHLSNATA
ncbi:Rhizopine catabolism protein MocA [Morella rubra]|uniref:Rhizopine catabolism protein MocA n=1 Tax=Morella rubra TaxID=262757 RepID=A0A6A1VZL5_9ROSI|nr:Rhizopine catabolism protein MocA [Morella rubra]